MTMVANRRIGQLFWLLSLSLNTSLGYYTIRIKPAQTECLRVRTPKYGALLSGNYDVLTEDIGEQSLTAWLAIDYSSEGDHEEPKTVWQSDGEFEEDYFAHFSEASTRYKLCFENVVGDHQTDESMADLDVGFNIRIIPRPRTLTEGESGPDAELALELIDASSELERSWQDLHDHFDFLRQREFSHEVLMQKIHDRVLGWTLVEAVLVVTMAVGQVLYWRKFFEQRRYL